MDGHPVGLSWYYVRTVFRFGREPMSTYEERLTLWWTTGFPAAIDLAEADARGYAGALENCVHTGLAQAYELSDEPAI